VAVKFAEEHLDQTFLMKLLKDQPQLDWSAGSEKMLQDSMRVKNITLTFDSDKLPQGRTFVEVHRVAGKKVLRVVVTMKNPDPKTFILTRCEMLMVLILGLILLILTLGLATTMVTVMEFLAQQCRIVALKACEDAWNTIASTIQYMVRHMHIRGYSMEQRKYLFITAWLAFGGFVVCLLNKKSPNRGKKKGPPIERPKDYPVFRVAVALFILCDVAAYVQSVVSPGFCSQHFLSLLELVSSTVFLAENVFVFWFMCSSYDRSNPVQVRISLIGLVLDQMAIWPAYIQVFFPSTHAELPTLSRGKPHDL